MFKSLKANLNGFIGETLFNTVSWLGLGKDYKIFKNIVIEAFDGTTQIDQIIVSKYGIFVIEVKTYKGWIFGNERNSKWTQVLYKQKNTFQNPLRQNYKHIKSLQYLLKLPENMFESLIIFSGEAKFKTDLPDCVTKGTGYLDYIKRYKNVILTDNEVSHVISKISTGRLSSADHKEYLRKRNNHQNLVNQSTSPQCQRCGRQMILRTAKTGNYKGQQFWGCTGYPSCRGIIKI